MALRKARNCAFVVAVLSRKNSRTSTACCANESRLSATAIPMTNLPPLIRTMPSGTSSSAAAAARRMLSRACRTRMLPGRGHVAQGRQEVWVGVSGRLPCC